MTILDKEKGSVVIRIVYAGAPLAGKTESIRSLSKLLFGGERGEKEFYTPDDAGGRTLYFDWLSYVGGYFKGYQVSCQLIGVPGQKTLQARRKMLLKMADVVVYVLDSETHRLDAGLEYYQEMVPWLERENEPPVGVVIQANKRDKENAAPIELIQQKFEDNPNLLIIETVATEQSGIREAFVSGVRIGLERATWLLSEGKMAYGTPDLECANDLLTLIQRTEAIARAGTSQLQSLAEMPRSVPLPRPANLDLSTAHLHRIIADLGENVEESGTKNEAPRLFASANESSDAETVSLEVIESNESSLSKHSIDDASAHVPDLPNKDVLAGSVFPPVSGRIILHKLQEEGPVSIEQNRDGDWQAIIGNHWKLLSRAGTGFRSVNDARQYLVQCAQRQQKFKHVISEHRCMTIVEPKSANDPQWRVWHIVRMETSLDKLLREALKNPVPRRIAELVFIIAEKFLGACKLFAQTDLNLPVNLSNIGLSRSMLGLNGSLLAFIDFVPMADFEENKRNLPIMMDLERNFREPIGDFLESPSGSNVPHILNLLKIYAKGHSEKEEMVDVLRTLFIGEH